MTIIIEDKAKYHDFHLPCKWKGLSIQGANTQQGTNKAENGNSEPRWQRNI